MTSETIDEDTLEMLEYPLKHYMNRIFIGVVDLRKVILAREEVETGIWKYDTPGQYIYLDEDGYAVTYDRQRVADEKVYYKFTDLLGVPDDIAFEFVATYEWKKTKNFDPDYPPNNNNEEE